MTHSGYISVYSIHCTVELGFNRLFDMFSFVSWGVWFIYRGNGGFVVPLVP